jgi:N6-L-threonylcarbamoyladenine synthase
MKILGIETSCDETGICILDAEGDIDNASIKILANELYSQIAIHAQYGGVFPVLAKRAHSQNLVPIFEKALENSKLLSYREKTKEIDDEKKALLRLTLAKEPELFDNLIYLAEKIEKPNIDAIAVTYGPGLEIALWVGVSFAKALGILWDIPIIPTNHMEGHIFAAMLQKDNDSYKIGNIKLPAVALLISGGHTEIVLIKNSLTYEVVGKTRDDAVGEAFDKVARILGLPYPGGPQISKLAEKERTENPNKKTDYPLPRPMIYSKDLDFSFSGIKTAVLYTVRQITTNLPKGASGEHLSEKDFSTVMTDSMKQDIACEFENAVVEVLIKKVQMAVEQYGAQTIILGGGVSANRKIRTDFKNLSTDLGIDYFIPEVSASTDNALMIAVAGYINLISGQKAQTEFKAEGNLTF